MASYIGNSPLAVGNYKKLDDISGSFNGSTVTFNITSSSVAINPVFPETLIISINGVIQEPTTAYTVSGSQITFTTAPSSGDDFFGVSIGERVDVGVPSDGTVGTSQIDSTSTFAIDSPTFVVDVANNKIGIGTTSPTNDALLTIKDTGLANPMARISFDSGDSDVTNGVKIGYTAATFAPDFEIANRDAGIIRISTSDTECARFTSGGDLFLNTTGAVGSGNPRLSIDNGSDGVCVATERSGTSSVAHFQFINGNGTVGSISTSGSNTAFNTSSDYRLKENVTPITKATERLKKLNPVRFNFIADPDITVDGFLAHEVSDHVPEAITGKKDAMQDEQYEITPAVLDDNGNEVKPAKIGTRSVPDYQGIDQSKLVPLLVATIIELEARITALESLEGK
jgi:hypothetical protein